MRPRSLENDQSAQKSREKMEYCACQIPSRGIGEGQKEEEMEEDGNAAASAPVEDDADEMVYVEGKEKIALDKGSLFDGGVL
jgi:hypothetical protein